MQDSKNARIRRPLVCYHSVAPPTLRQFTVPAMHVKFEFGVHNSMYDRADFGDEAQMPELVIGPSELCDAGYGLKVVQDTAPGQWLALYGVQISARRARYLRDKVC